MPPTENPQQVVQINNASKSSGSGSIIGIIIIVLLLIFGGLYFWGQQLNEREEPVLPFVQGTIDVN